MATTTKTMELKKELVTIAKVQFGGERLHQETLNFVCDVYYDGKKVGYAHNDGHGGCTFVNSENHKGYDFMQSLKKYFSSLPPIPFTDFGGGVLPQSLDGHIDELVGNEYVKKQNEKAMKKFAKKFTHQIIFINREKLESGEECSYYPWTFKQPIAELVKNPANIEIIKKGIIARMEKYSKEGMVCINTNIDFILNSIK